jgi:hypothetical protein
LVNAMKLFPLIGAVIFFHASVQDNLGTKV